MWMQVLIRLSQLFVSAFVGTLLFLLVTGVVAW